MLKIDRLYTTLRGNRIKNRCMESTKIRAVYRQTNLTKSAFRDHVK